jgi:hypothetical protein
MIYYRPCKQEEPIDCEVGWQRPQVFRRRTVRTCDNASGPTLESCPPRMQVPAAPALYHPRARPLARPRSPPAAIVPG